MLTALWKESVPNCERTRIYCFGLCTWAGGHLEICRLLVDSKVGLRPESMGGSLLRSKGGGHLVGCAELLAYASNALVHLGAP